MKTLFPHGVRAIMAFLLVLASQPAFAFTLIEIPESNTSPGSSITDSTNFNTQMEPVLGAIQTHLQNLRRTGMSRESAQRDNVFASNGYSETLVDSDFIRVSSHGASAGALQSLWLNSTSTTFKNNFSGTRHNGDQHMLLGGYDITFTDRYVLGVAVSFEKSNINTEFNLGNQQSDGYSINPYFAYLISDAWSIDLSLGFGEFETDQYRTPTPLLLPVTVDSSFDTSREFVATNLTYSRARGNWFFTGWLGFLVADKEQDSYRESDATEIDGQDVDLERWSLGGEAAWGRGAGETYLGLIYEVDTDLDEIEFTTGDQPSNDDDSLLLAIGWRYYGEDLVANFEFNSRQGADDSSESSISTTLRIDL